MSWETGGTFYLYGDYRALQQYCFVDRQNKVIDSLKRVDRRCLRHAWWPQAQLSGAAARQQCAGGVS